MARLEPRASSLQPQQRTCSTVRSAISSSDGPKHLVDAVVLETARDELRTGDLCHDVLLLVLVAKAPNYTTLSDGPGQVDDTGRVSGGNLTATPVAERTWETRLAMPSGLSQTSGSLIPASRRQPIIASTKTPRKTP